jgi:hypothetical protein
MAPAALALALTLTAGCTDSDATDQTSPAASDSAAAVATTLPHYVLTANLIPDVATDPQGDVGGNQAFFAADEAIAAKADQLMQALEQDRDAILMNWMNYSVSGPGPERLYELNDADGFYGDYAAAALTQYLYVPGVAGAEADPQALWDAIGPLVSEAGLDGQVFGVQSVSDPSVQSAGADGAGSGAADEAGTGFSVGSDGSPQDQSGTVP